MFSAIYIAKLFDKLELVFFPGAGFEWEMKNKHN